MPRRVPRATHADELPSLLTWIVIAIGIAAVVATVLAVLVTWLLA